MSGSKFSIMKNTEKLVLAIMKKKEQMERAKSTQELGYKGFIIPNRKDRATDARTDLESRSKFRRKINSKSGYVTDSQMVKERTTLPRTTDW